MDFHRRLEDMYARAPISGMINDHRMKISDGRAELELTIRPEHCHTAKSLHGSVYFKLLDDTAFFAAQTKDPKFFLFTTSFTLYLMRPVKPGATVSATGAVVSATKALIVAESSIFEDGKLVAKGSGTFQRSSVSLESVNGRQARL